MRLNFARSTSGAVLALGVALGWSVAAQETRVIHVMTDEISPESQAFYQAAADAFEVANPGVTLEFDFQANMDQALAVRVAAGEPPEIASMQLERLLTYADMGLLEPATW